MDCRFANCMSVIGFTVVLALVPGFSAHADQLIDGDQIVIGNTCVGFDCVNGESFAGDELRLKENNVRLRLEDSTASGTLGKSWFLVANDSASGGSDFFSFALDESDTHVLRSGVAAANSTAIGIDSEVVDDAVSIGNAGTLRRLVRVAKALEDTQAVIKRQLDEGGLAARERTAELLESRLTALEREVVRLEGEAEPSSSGGVMGPSSLIVLAALAVFAAIGRGTLPPQQAVNRGRSHSRAVH